MNIKKSLLITILAIAVSITLLTPFVVDAALTVPTVSNPTGNTANSDLKPLIERVANDVSRILVIAGIAILVIMVIWGAILYMTAGGNEDQAKKARTVIFNGVIGGVILIALSFVIDLVFSAAGLIKGP